MAPVGKLFGAPKPPKLSLPPLQSVPSRSASAGDIASAQEESKARLRRQQGRASTILTSGQGVSGDDSTGLATKKLLGG